MYELVVSDLVWYQKQSVHVSKKLHAIYFTDLIHRSQRESRLYFSIYRWEIEEKSKSIIQSSKTTLCFLTDESASQVG